MNKQKIAVTFFSLALVGVLFFGAKEVSANWFGLGNSNLISNLAKKLGIGEEKVKQAFESVQSERQKEMRTLFEQRLSQSVKDGKITEAQKQAILKKHDEMQTKRTTQRQEMQNWLKANGLEDVHPFGFGFGNRGMHGGWMMK